MADLILGWVGGLGVGLFLGWLKLKRENRLWVEWAIKHDQLQAEQRQRGKEFTDEMLGIARPDLKRMLAAIPDTEEWFRRMIPAKPKRGGPRE